MQALRHNESYATNRFTMPLQKAEQKEQQIVINLRSKKT